MLRLDFSRSNLARGRRQLLAAFLASTLLAIPAAFAQTQTAGRNPAPVTFQNLLNPDPADWLMYSRTYDSQRYSPLEQINRQNVGRLQVAWTFDTGTKGEYQSNSLIVDGVLYTAAPDRKIIALDAATGREQWRFDPVSEHNETMGRRQRGVMFFQRRAPNHSRVHLFLW